MSGEALQERLVSTAEKVIAAWFYDAKFRVAWKPEPALFHVHAHAAMAEIMAARGSELDDGALTIELRRLGKLELFGKDAPHEIAQIIHGQVGVLDPWETLRELRELVALRTLRHSLLDSLRELDTDLDLAKAKTAVANALVATESANPAKVLSLRQALADEMRRMLEGARPPGCATGSVALDKATGGIRPGDVWAIGAPSNWGKSSYLCSLFRSAVAQGMQMLIVSGEDQAGLYAQRLITGWTGVNAWRAREGVLWGGERVEVSNVLTGVPDFPFFIDAMGRPAEAVVADIRSTLACSEVPGSQWLIAVDYIQVFRSQLKHQDRRNEIVHCARVFTDAIKRAGAGGILFSQITVTDGKAKMREADDILHAAEVALFGEKEKSARLDVAGKKTGLREERNFFVAKIKNGPSGFHVPLSWDAHSAAFVENLEELEAAE